MALAERWYGRVFIVTTALLLCATSMGHQLSQTATLVILSAGVVLLGLPHGALDPMVASKTFTGHRAYTTTIFYFGYLALVIGYWLLWNRFPTVGLASFLLIAAVHFGSDWESRGTWLVRCAYGCAVVTLPALRFPAEVLSIYAMLGTSHAAILVTVSKVVAPVAIGVALSGAAIYFKQHGSDALELLTILAGALFLHPLIFFTCYFALLHSPRHLLETAQGLGLTSLKRIYGTTLPVVLATMLLGAIAYILLPHIGFDARLLRIVFIGLAALTVPHMLLDTFAHQENQLLQQRGSPS